MIKTCLKCGHVNDQYKDSPFAACPQCEAIYAKVEAAQTKKETDAQDRLIAEQKQAEEQERIKQHTLLSNLSVCTDCLTTGQPVTITKGSLLIEIILWLCFLLPGIIYTVWRHISRYQGCPACGHDSMIPAPSPKGKELLERQNS